MSFLGDLVLGFLIESMLLVAVWAGIAASAAWLHDLPSGGGWSPRTFWFALVGAMVAGSLSRRLGLPVAWELDLGRRGLPVVWSIGGGLVGAFLAAVGRPQRTGEGASAG